MLVICVSSIGLLVSQSFPCKNLVMAHALFPLALGIVIIFFPCKAIDVVIFADVILFFPLIVIEYWSPGTLEFPESEAWKEGMAT